MPQATQELRDRFPMGDDQAWDLIKGLVENHRGILQPKKDTDLDLFTNDMWQVIDYLCQEWDYGWNPKPVEG